MNERYLLEGRDGGIALLRRDDGARLRIPASWLPEGAREGATLDVEVSPAPDATDLAVRLVDRVDEPDAESVGA